MLSSAAVGQANDKEHVEHSRPNYGAEAHVILCLCQGASRFTRLAAAAHSAPQHSCDDACLSIPSRCNSSANH